MLSFQPYIQIISIQYFNCNFSVHVKNDQTELQVTSCHVKTVTEVIEYNT